MLSAGRCVDGPEVIAVLVIRPVANQREPLAIGRKLRVARPGTIQVRTFEQPFEREDRCGCRLGRLGGRRAQPDRLGKQHSHENRGGPALRQERPFAAFFRLQRNLVFPREVPDGFYILDPGYTSGTRFHKATKMKIRCGGQGLRVRAIGAGAIVPLRPRSWVALGGTIAEFGGVMGLLPNSVCYFLSKLNPAS